MPANLYKRSYTQAVPDGAERVRLDADGKVTSSPDGAPGVRFLRKGRWVNAALTECGKRCRVETEHWYGWVDGKHTRLSKNRAVAAEDLQARLAHADRRRRGLVGPFEAQEARPLADHLADFRAHLDGKGDRPRHVGQAVAHVRAFLDGTGARLVADLDLHAAQQWLAGLRKADAPALPAGESFTVRQAAKLLGVKLASVSPLVKRRALPALGSGKSRRLPRATVEALLADRARGAGPETVNHYARSLRSFCRWMAGPGRRTSHDPLAGLTLLNASQDVRRARRELPPAELHKVLSAARSSERTFRGLSGEDRFHVYAVACATGFRAGGMAALTPACFDLGDAPTATLPARADKAKRGKVQPIPLDVAELMREYLKGRDPAAPVWPGKWAGLGAAAQMLRVDLAAAGVPYAVEGPDGPRYFDFHGFRHSYLSALGKAGVDLRTVQLLAGHSTSRLTERYSHRGAADLAGAVAMLPGLLPAPDRALAVPPDPNSAATPLPDTVARQTRNPSASPNPSVLAGIGRIAGDSIGVADGDRTRDLQSHSLHGEEASPLDGNVLRQTQPPLAAPWPVESDAPGEMPADLARVVRAWEGLSEAERAAVMDVLSKAGR